uniref:Uncharacterized protein n=1 Tax=Desulfobacca acetoxidans TaxID=60893 RepID=A0A7V4LDL3_9BACT
MVTAMQPMWRYILAAVMLGIMLLWAAWGRAEEAKPEEKKEEAAAAEDRPQFSGSVDFLTQYVFRGIALSKHSLVIQPSMTVSYKGFAVNIWGNWDTDERNPYGLTPDRRKSKWNETDFTISYSREVFTNFTLSGGFIYYALDSNNSPYDSMELYGGLAYKFPWFEAGFSAYREIYHFPGWYLWWYVSRSFDLPFAGASLDLLAGWSAVLSDDKAVFPTYNGKYYRSLNAGQLAATLNFPVGKYVKISPKIQYWYALGGQSTYTLNNLSWDRKHNHVLGGVNISVAF